jgi:hypothetical protein
MDLESLFGRGALLHQRARVIAIMPSANHPAIDRRGHGFAADSRRASTSGSQLQVSQYLGPDGDHRDEQRRRGERGGFLN